MQPTIGEMSPHAALPILLLALAGFLSSAAARVIDPLLSVIAADFETTVPDVSIVVAAFTLPYGLFQLLIGPAGDRFGKLRVVQWALLAFTATSAACALAGSVAQLAGLRVASGAASAAIIPVAMAFIADAVPYAERQVTLSRFLNGVVMAQVLAGPAGGVFGQYVGWRGVFLLLAAGGAVAAVALTRRLRVLPAAGGSASFSMANYMALARHGPARWLLACTFLDGALLMGCFPFLAPFMHAEFGLSYAQVGLVLACFGAGALSYTRCAKFLVPRLREAGCVGLGAALMACAAAGAALSPAWWLFIPIEAAMGLGFYLLHAVMQARATELLPHARATAVSSFAFVLFVGQSIGALGMAAMIARAGYSAAFLVESACIVAFGLGLYRLMRRT